MRPTLLLCIDTAWAQRSKTFMIENLDIASGLLQQAELAVARNEAARQEARLRGEAFNVFRTCGVNHYENAHSSILAEWLSPDGSHGQGDLFLKRFISLLSSTDRSLLFADEFDTDRATVSTEHSTDTGRLDILIEDHAGKALIIENKIYASDQGEQLKRYANYANEKYGKGKYLLMYLTLDGCEASEQSGKGVDYLRISYKETITAWLDDCIKSVYDKPFLRETMIQYRNLVNQLTGQNMDKPIEEKLVAEMLKCPEGVAAIVNASYAMERCLIEASLFKPLREFAAGHRGWTFEVDKDFWSKEAYKSFNLIVQPELKIVFQSQRKGWRDFRYGIFDKRPGRRSSLTLPGLEVGDDVWWPYGIHCFDRHINWTIDDIVEFSHDGGEFLRYITETVESLLEAMEKHGILSSDL